MRVATESGSVYEIAGSFVQRYNAGYQKRGDEEWQRLLNTPRPVVGERMMLIMESLSRYGPDDHGTPLDQVAAETTRITTPVVEIIA